MDIKQSAKSCYCKNGSWLDHRFKIRELKIIVAVLINKDGETGIKIYLRKKN
jgi:hypothetical protein